MSKKNYYDIGGIPTFDVLEAKLTHEQYKGFLLGNIIKYSLRANHKEQFDSDVKKIETYSRVLQALNDK